MGVTTPDIWAVTARRKVRNVMPAHPRAECHHTGKLAELSDRPSRSVDMGPPAQPTLADITADGTIVPVIWRAVAKTGGHLCARQT